VGLGGDDEVRRAEVGGVKGLKDGGGLAFFRTYAFHGLFFLLSLRRDSWNQMGSAGMAWYGMEIFSFLYSHDGVMKMGI